MKWYKQIYNNKLLNSLLSELNAWDECLLFLISLNRLKQQMSNENAFRRHLIYCRWFLPTPYPLVDVKTDTVLGYFPNPDKVVGHIESGTIGLLYIILTVLRSSQTGA